MTDHLHKKLAEMAQDLDNRDKQLVDRDQQIIALITKVRRLQQCIIARDLSINKLYATSIDYWKIRNDLTQTQLNLITQNAKIEALQSKGISQATEIQALRSKDVAQTIEIEALRSKVTVLYSSTSWRVTYPFRLLIKFLRRVWGIVTPATQIDGTGTDRILECDFDGQPPAEHSIADKQEYVENTDYKLFHNRTPQRWGVLTPKHTLFVAHLVASSLRSHGWSVEIISDSEIYFTHDMYVVICAQAFPFQHLPPLEKTIIYQMEQSTSNRWFTAEYINLLKKCRAVLDYSLDNIKFLSGYDITYPHIYYLPIGPLPNYRADIIVEMKTCDVLFYGTSAGSPRRQRLLRILHEHFDVKEYNDIFGDDMVRIIKSTRLVVNLHYYEESLLETTRIQECLSLNVPVVSEGAQNQNEYPEITQSVIFFEEKNEEDMVRVVAAALSGEAPSKSIEATEAAIKEGSERFNFMFNRFLTNIVQI